MLSCVRPFATLWTVPLQGGIPQARILEWAAVSSSRGSSWPRGQTCISRVSCIGRWILHHWATWEAPAFFKNGKVSPWVELESRGVNVEWYPFLKSPSCHRFWEWLSVWSLFTEESVLLAAMPFLYPEMPQALREILLNHMLFLCFNTLYVCI